MSCRHFLPDDAARSSVPRHDDLLPLRVSCRRLPRRRFVTFVSPTHDDYDVVGYWDPADNRIVLLQFLPDRRASYIRHEALHAIIRRVDHPDEYFVRRCLNVIHGPENPDDSGP